MVLLIEFPYKAFFKQDASQEVSLESLIRCQKRSSRMTPVVKTQDSCRLVHRVPFNHCDGIAKRPTSAATWNRGIWSEQCTRGDGYHAVSIEMSKLLANFVICLRLSKLLRKISDFSKSFASLRQVSHPRNGSHLRPKQYYT